MGSLSARYDEGYDKQAIDERIAAAQRAARDGKPLLKNFNMDHELVSVKWNPTKQAAAGATIIEIWTRGSCILGPGMLYVLLFASIRRVSFVHPWFCV